MAVYAHYNDNDNLADNQRDFFFLHGRSVRDITHQL